MKTAIVAGASGLIGRELARLLDEDYRYGRVILLVRKPVDITLSKATQVIYDYDHPDTSQIRGDEFYCCLGTTIKTAGSQENFKKVDFTYVLNTAQAAVSNGVKTMALISAMGANPASRVFYNRTKGEVEEAVSKLPFESLHIIRPSLLLGNRMEYRRGERIAGFLMNIFKSLIPLKYRAIRAERVAKSMIYLVNRGKPGIHIHESDVLATVPGA